MPLPAILGVVSTIQTALGVISAFKGSPQVAKVTGQVQDAIRVITAFTPLVQQFGRGEEVTLEDAHAALAGAHVSQDEFDALIASKSA